MTLKVPRRRTSVGDLAGHPLQLCSYPVDIGRNYSHAVQNLEGSYLGGHRSFGHESVVEFEKGGAEVFDFFIDLADSIL
jgi:hypothetical protein